MKVLTRHPLTAFAFALAVSVIVWITLGGGRP
jgi:hypothetical protein